MSKTIESLYVTLKRSFAGTPETKIKTLKALGLKHLHQTLRVPNNEKVRGALMKVRSMVIVEPDYLYKKRRVAENEARKLRDPIFIKH